MTLSQHLKEHEAIDLDSHIRRIARRVASSNSGGTSGGGTPTASATYIVQTPSADLTNEQALSVLATGILLNTTGTGVLSIAVEGTDYYKPGGTDVALADGGTGSSTAAGARTNLGLGTAAVVNTDLADLNEATIETAIDTLANLTSIQGRTVTLADAGANAIFGWDDTAGAYENLTQAEARTILGLGTAAYVATDLADLNEATIEAAIDTLTSMTGAISTPTSITLSGTASTINAKNTSDSASVQIAIFEGDRATMADNDEAYVSLQLSNDAGTQKEFARIAWVALDVNAGTGEDGSIDISVMSGGTLTDAMSIEAGSIYPLTTDAMSLGTSTQNWSDLFLDLGAVINFDGGDVTITHSANALDIDGGVVDFGSMPTVATVSMLTISSADTLSNKTLTAPKFANGGFIADANGNELIIFTTTASAVNEWTLANGSTGVNPSLTASGEANVGLDFILKGTGTFNIKGNATQAAELRLYEDTDAGTNFTALKVGTQAGNITYTLPTTDGDASQFLQTDGSGVLTWADAAGGSSTEVLALIASQVNASSVGDTYTDTAGDTYAETTSQTRTTLTASRIRKIYTAIGGHVSAGTGTFQLYNFTDGTSLGTATTTSTSEATIAASNSNSSSNNGDAITLRVKNSSAGATITIDAGGFAEGDYSDNVSGTGRATMAFYSGWIADISVGILKGRTTATLTAVMDYPVVTPNNSALANVGASFGTSEANTVIARTPATKIPSPDSTAVIGMTRSAISLPWALAVSAQLKQDDI